MPTIQHSLLGNSELHEPKGVATASSNETYVANGSGSGVWAEPEPKGASAATANQVYVANGGGSGVWRNVYTQGFEDYNHAGSSQSLTAGVSVKLLNDGAGSFTNTAYRLPGRSAIWNTVSNQFDWSGAGLALGDTVDIRLDFTVTTTGANDDLSIILNMAVGSGGDYSLTPAYNEWRNAGTYPFTTFYSVYMGDTNTLNYPAEVHMLAGTTGDTVQVNGWYVRTVPCNPVMS